MLKSTADMGNVHSRGGESDPTHARMGSEAAPHRLSGQEWEAITNAIERLVALEVDSQAWVYVDDENHLPSYARHVGTAWGGQALEDEELDYAIGWLPAEAFLNDESPWPGSYNPYITLAHLRTMVGP